jgi:Na+/melibiose symporter-like transporter
VGAGSAAGFLGAAKVVSDAFPESSYSRMIGLTVTVGLAGATGTAKLLSLFQHFFSAKALVIVLSVVSIVLAVISLNILKPLERKDLEKHNHHDLDAGFSLASMAVIFSMKNIWILGLANLLLMGAIEGFADVWGVNYLTSCFPISRDVASDFTTAVLGGMMLSGIVLPALSQRIHAVAVVIACGLGMVACFAGIMFFLPYQHTVFLLLFGLIGFFSGYQNFVLIYGNTLVAPQLRGVVTAFLNGIGMLAGSFFHVAIGNVLEMNSSLNGSGLPAYSAQAYQKAISVIPGAAVLGTGILFFFIFLPRQPTKPITT